MYMASAPPVQQHTSELWQKKEDSKPCVTSVTIFMPQEKYLPNFTFRTDLFVKDKNAVLLSEDYDKTRK